MTGDSQGRRGPLPSGQQVLGPPLPFEYLPLSVFWFQGSCQADPLSLAGLVWWTSLPLAHREGL